MTHVEMARALRQGSLVFVGRISPEEARCDEEKLYAAGASTFYLRMSNFRRLELEELELGVRPAGRSLWQDEFWFWFWDDVHDLLNPVLGPEAPEELHGVTVNGESVRRDDW